MFFPWREAALGDPHHRIPVLMGWLQSRWRLSGSPGEGKGLQARVVPQQDSSRYTKEIFYTENNQPLEQHPQECHRVPITGTSQRWLGRALNNPMQVPKAGLGDLSSSLPICLMDCFVIPWFYTESQRLFVSWPKLRIQASILRPKRIIFLHTYKSNS